jgi:hypothetical protein
MVAYTSSPDENQIAQTVSQEVQLNFITDVLVQFTWSLYTKYGILLLSIAREQ